MLLPYPVCLLPRPLEDERVRISGVLLSCKQREKCFEGQWKKIVRCGPSKRMLFLTM